MSFTTSTYPGTDDTYSYIQSRAEMNYELIDEYASEMKAGSVFEAAEAINDNGHKFIYDGAHRFEGAKAAGVALLVHWKTGTRAEAEWLSLSANQRHGLRRSKADKQRVVKNALLHAKAANLSNREIGRHTGIDHKTVGKLRKELELSGDIPQMDERTVTRNGTTFTQAAKAKPNYMNEAEIEQTIHFWLKDRPSELHLEIMADIARKNEDGQRYYGSILKAMPLVYIEANVWTTCLAMLEQMKTAKAEPEYISITQLEQGVRAWLNSKWYKAPKVHIEVLTDIKNKTAKGPVRLQELVNDDLLPGPRRKRDVVQACNNVLDQTKAKENSAKAVEWAQQLEQRNKAERQAAKAEPKNKHIATLICYNCGEQTIEATNIGKAIHCTTCRDEWIGPADFEYNKAAYETAVKEIQENITPISHEKPCPQCSGTVIYGLSACLDCKGCEAHWATESEFLAAVDKLWHDGPFETKTAEANREAETALPGCSICRTEPEPGTVLHPFGDGFICTECETQIKIANQPTFARTPCPKCNEMKIEIKPLEDSVLCHHCKQSWDAMDTFHKERMALRTASAQPIAKMPAATCADCGIPNPGASWGDDSEALYTLCKSCHSKATDPSLADHPTTMMQRLGLIERLNTLAQTIPDEHLTAFETWVAELEDEFQPAYTA